MSIFERNLFGSSGALIWVVWGTTFGSYGALIFPSHTDLRLITFGWNGGLRGFSEIIQTANPFHIVNSLSGCFSWKVRSVCPDGTVSGWSSTSCSCLPIIALCKAVVPTNLNCLGSAFGQTLTWDILGFKRKAGG